MKRKRFSVEQIVAVLKQAERRVGSAGFQIARRRAAVAACSFFCCFSADQPGHALPGFANQGAL